MNEEWRGRTGYPLIAAGGVILLLAAFLLSVFTGNEAVRASALFHALLGGGDASARLILWQLRVPRAFAAAICGAGLAVSGLLLQASMDNVLAAPGVLGINAGAACFHLVGALLFPYAVFGRQASAFLGALLATGLVYAIARGAGVTRTTLILAGVAVSSLFTACVNAMIAVRPDIVADKVAFQLGGLQRVTAAQLLIAAPVTVGGIAAALVLAGGIDLFSLGDETAGGLGLSVHRVRLAALLLATALAAAAVGLCGLIGFVGLIVPNLVRAAGVRGTRRQLVACALFGSSFLLFCDLIARRLFFPYELPVGLFLSFLGTPFFIAMLVRRKRRLSV